MTKYTNLKDKIDSIIEQSEKSNLLVKKRTESIASFKKITEELANELKEIKSRQNREYYYTRDRIIEFSEKIKEVEGERDHYQTKFKELENGFGKKYEEYKQRLNSHYYLLQKAFNDYVKGKTKDDTQDRLERSNKEILGKIEELENKMLKMFFDGIEKR